MTYRMNVRTVTLLSVLIAMQIVLSRFLSIHTWNTKIGFSFVPVVVAAMLFGALEAGVVAAFGDIIGAMMFPVGAYFPGFTLTAFFHGIVYAMLLKKKASTGRIILAVLIVQIAGSLFLNTYWISVLYGSPYWPLFFTRIYQTFVMSFVQIAVILVLNHNVIPRLKNVI
nr:folate family ECF transporter S component [uncultured Lachnoclostridium sp.]